jgi:hypothetical protein
MAANQKSASATYTNTLDRKNAIHRDATNLNLGFGGLKSGTQSPRPLACPPR